MGECERFPSILLWGIDLLIYSDLKEKKWTHLTDSKYVIFIDDSVVIKSGYFDWALEELDFSSCSLSQNYPSWGSKIKFIVYTWLSLL